MRDMVRLTAVLACEIMRFLCPQNTGIPTELLNPSSIYCIASQLKEITLILIESSRLSAPQGKIVSNLREQVQIPAGIGDYLHSNAGGNALILMESALAPQFEGRSRAVSRGVVT